VVSPSRLVNLNQKQQRDIILIEISVPDKKKALKIAINSLTLSHI
jgi:hypothetical protein